ncbi:hypothetical protein ACUSIJ_15210 [Pseudochelatococcus sp. B33]
MSDADVLALRVKVLEESLDIVNSEIVSLSGALREIAEALKSLKSDPDKVTDTASDIAERIGRLRDVFEKRQQELRPES